MAGLPADQRRVRGRARLEPAPAAAPSDEVKMALASSELSARLLTLLNRELAHHSQSQRRSLWFVQVAFAPSPLLVAFC